MPKTMLHVAAKLPKVSVVITNYNYAAYVIEAIRSVQRQTYQNFECVVIDDYSNDGSFALISEFLSGMVDERFRCLRLGKNKGQMGAIKAGIENITGVFVTLLDADDVLAEEFLQTHLEAHLNSAYSAAMTASDTYQIDCAGNLIESTFHTLQKLRSNLPQGPVKPLLATDLGEITDHMLTFQRRDQNLICCYVDRAMEGWHVVAMSSLMFRRAVLDLIIPDNTEPLRICADYYLVTAAHAIAGTITISTALSFFRLHGKNAFSFNPAMGGTHLPGHFPEHYQAAIHREIAKHIISHYDKLSPIIGWWVCKALIQKGLPRKHIYKETIGASNVRALFGSRRLFKIKYGYLYPLLKKDKWQ